MPGPYLPTAWRKQLAKTIDQARVAATTGVTEAIRRLGVAEAKAPAHLDDEARRLRNALRAHGRALGDRRDPSGSQAVANLIEAAAYEHWHRMLFARFLAERKLLIHPEHGVHVTIEDCKELAAEEGLRDAWSVAERYATRMLPAIFRPDDPVLALHAAPEHAQALQRLVTELDAAVFEASDSLGWTYQFWRETEKKEVNASGRKIGGDELPAVTQLFTEPYMVRFLLDNTLGAWWAGKALAAQPELARTAPDESALRDACALRGIDWEFLRFVREDGMWRPAAGTFPGWPARAAEITVMDPCCGSGHFLTEAFAILAAMRMQEEGLGLREAAEAVLRDNLFGLEIDGRCVQIATFAVALTAWRLAGEVCALPVPHIAWVGQPLAIGRNEFATLANGNGRLTWGLERLWDLFSQAHTLGSLMDPRALAGTLDAAGFDELASILDGVFARLKNAEFDRAEGAIAARGMTDAAALLSRCYTLQATNVPYLGRGKQAPPLADYLAHHFGDAKADLATAMLLRILRLSIEGGTVACVTPQSWLFQKSYQAMRRRLLLSQRWDFVFRIGEHGFESDSAAGAFVILLGLNLMPPAANCSVAISDLGKETTPSAKADYMRNSPIILRKQNEFLRGREYAVAISEIDYEHLFSIRDLATSSHGIGTFDSSRFNFSFWEQSEFGDKWIVQQSTPERTLPYDGCDLILRWENGMGELQKMMEQKKLLEGYTSGKWKAGVSQWGKRGVLVSLMRDLPATLYVGGAFDANAAAIIPEEEEDLDALWTFCKSGGLTLAVRTTHHSIYVPPHTFLSVGFDRARWRDRATHEYPEGLPEPYTDDPSQWLFHGHPAPATAGTAFHAALARLAGYRWPAERDCEMCLSEEARAWIAKTIELPGSDLDGILCLPPVAGERPLADRLRAWLVTAIPDWSAAIERRLVAEADARFEKKPPKDPSLEAWLRDRFFAQHCVLFHQRPFLWQVWDGLKDGFSAILHYHRLNRATLEKLTYTYLNDWITRMRAADRPVHAEKARELQQKLELILEGEKPYDIFVRWKPLERQPLGWDRDLDDGVRMNIRPFVTAGILRATPKIKWGKDRGTDVASAPWYHLGPEYGGKSGDRINDHHTTLDQKRAARAALKKAS